MSSKLEPAIQSNDTGQQIHCFDRCHLIVIGMSNIKEVRYKTRQHTPNANMVDHSVGAQDELHESEASEASVFVLTSASPEKSCFVEGLVCFISLCLRVFEFLNATRRDRNCPSSCSFKGPVLVIMLCTPLLLFWFSQGRGVCC